MRRDYLLAGVGLGLACASKYTAGIVLVPLAAAVAARYLRGATRAPAGRRALGGIALAARRRRWRVPARQPLRAARLPQLPLRTRSTSRRSRPKRQGKLGAPKQGGVLYYLWSLTWGLGWVPALAALGGAVTRLALASPRWAGCSCPRRCCSWRSWAFRAATSDAGCCRSFRSSACWRRSSRCTLRRRSPGASARGAARAARASLRIALFAAVTSLAVRPGARLQRPLRPRALARRHPHADAGVDGRAHSRPHARSWSSRWRPTGGRTRWRKYPSLVSLISPRGALEPNDHAHRGHRGLRAHARPGADRLLRAPRLLLGGARLHPVRARRSPIRGELPLALAYYRALPSRAKSSTAPRPTRAGSARSRSTSTGASTTTRSPTAAPGPR